MEKIARWLPGSLLTVIALTQIYASAFHDLSPWKGGGFGMFAVVDAPSARTWSVHGVDESGQPCLVYIPRDGEGSMPRRFEKSFRAFPSAAGKNVVADFASSLELQATTLESLAQSAELDDALRRWPPQQERGRYLKQTSAESSSDDIQRVRAHSFKVNAWRMKFDASSMSMSCFKIGDSREEGES